MAKNITAAILKFPGTNNDAETERALAAAGFSTKILPVTLLNKNDIMNYSLIVIPGGFSYGDYVHAGKLATLELELRLGSALHTYKETGGLLLGICNGFQILLQSGLLPAGSLTVNSNKRFICRWVRLKVINRKNPFLGLLPEEIELPVAHAEGRFITDETADKSIPDSVCLKYSEEVNGSQYDIAGISDKENRVFGLMPHPERFLFTENHYAPEKYNDNKWGYGYYFFKSAFDYLSK